MFSKIKPILSRNHRRLSTKNRQEIAKYTIINLYFLTIPLSAITLGFIEGANRFNKFEKGDSVKRTFSTIDGVVTGAITGTILGLFSPIFIPLNFATWVYEKISD